MHAQGIVIQEVMTILCAQRYVIVSILYVSIIAKDSVMALTHVLHVLCKLKKCSLNVAILHGCYALSVSEFVRCAASCQKTLDCSHPCQEECWKPCPPCSMQVQKYLPECGHYVQTSCSKPIQSIKCTASCKKMLKCSHPCQEECSEICTTSCEVLVERTLPCGHSVEIPCYENPSSYLCPNPCGKLIPECLHICQGTCGTCKQGKAHVPCLQMCTKSLPCGHFAQAACFVPIQSVRCESPCTKVLACSHACQEQCGMMCTASCERIVETVLSCGHSAEIPCHIDHRTYVCPKPCRKKLPDCLHTCKGTCGTCHRAQGHVKCSKTCGRSLPCGHICLYPCHMVCPPCPMPCQKGCVHGVCPNKCGYPCLQCMEKCEWKHHACELLCYEICSRPRCDLPCENLLQCGHPCSGICGEPCPYFCRSCTLGFRSEIGKGKSDESDRLFELQDCGHIFGVRSLDAWMETEQCESWASAILPKSCPECETPITSSFRYSNVLKQRFHQIEQTKKRILEIYHINEGTFFLLRSQYHRAVREFLAVLEINGNSHEAHLRLGCLLYLQSNYWQSIVLLRHLVKHSPLNTAVKELHSGKERAKAWSRGRRNRKLMALIENLEMEQLPCEVQANKQQAIEALLQWAAALSNIGRASSATTACEISLKEEPNNEVAEQVLKLLRNGKRIPKDTLAATLREAGKKGRWYQCPKGHYHVAREFGLKCPDCNKDNCT
ncbi:hypothetical protein KP509_04G101100 [Ceratopteris richardii]|uniref:NFX1-type zinc finger-containing protein 1 n=1 Tax=Ceratopteris richardii TaxID=49495 RepID=A0A8T2V2Z7_CERRI|nr:hypothetical protein KP509_04G101100 [Ceratopteris richardii]